MNEYDDLLASDATQKGNEYDAQLQLDQDQQRTNLRASMLGAQQQNPDEYAKAKQLGTQTGIPAPIVARNLKDVQQHATLNEYDQLLTSSPTLAKGLQIQDFANVAHDDVPALQQVERATFGDYAAAPLKRLGGSFNDLARFINTVLGAPVVGYDAAKGIITGQPTTAAQDAYFGKFVQPLDQNRQAFELRPGANIGEQALGGLGDAAGLLSQIVLSGGGAAPEAAAGRVTMSLPEYLRGAVEHATKAMALPSTAGAVNTAGDVTAQGGDANTAFHAALVNYLLGTAQGVLPLSVEGGLLKRLFTGGLSGVASAEVSRQASNAVLPTEMQQPTKPDDLIASAITSAVMGGVMGPRAAPSITRMVSDARAAEAAPETAQSIQNVLDAAAQSKLRTRDPAAFQQFVEQSAQQGGLQEVYVNGEMFLQQAQAAGVDPASISPTATSQLPEALATGGDVRIPIGELATNVPGSGLEQSLVPHLRMTPEGMTQEEANQFMQSNATRFQEAAAQALTDHADDTTFQRSAEAVKTNITDQLTKANRFTPDVNDQYASLASAFYTSTAARLGVTPEEMLRRYPLKIAAESVLGDSRMEQGNQQIETPEFKNWFGDSKVVDENGKPLVVYHGTKSAFDTFDMGKAGQNGQAMGVGFYFTDSKPVAGGYGDTMSVYLRAENPTFSLEKKTVTKAQVKAIIQTLEKSDPDFLSNYGDVSYKGRAKVLGAAMQDIYDSAANDAEVLSALVNVGGVTRDTVMRAVVDHTGKDGFIADASMASFAAEEGDKIYTVLLPEQIKSAIGNRGTFDANDPNILHQSDRYKGIEQAKDLTPVDRAIEQRLTDKVVDHYDEAKTEYASLKDTEGGKILNTDTARELSPDYLADRTKSAAVHEPASAFIKKLYAEKLQEAPKDDELPMVLFTAGGTGAGKTSAVQQVADVHNLAQRAQIVYDTNMNTFAGAKQKVDQALEAGKIVRIVMVMRDPVDALVNGALPRAMRQEGNFGSGRTVPVREHIKTHIGAAETILKLAETYKGNPDVQIRVVDNSRGKGGAVEVPLENVQPLDYNTVEPAVKAALENEYEKGNISQSVYAGFRDDQDVADPAEATGGVRQEPGALDGQQYQRQGEGLLSRLAQGVRDLFQARANQPGARGSLTFGKDLSKGSTISLLKNADLSTFMHESGHFYLEVLNDLSRQSDVPPEIKADMDGVLRWFGVKGDTPEERSSTWNNMSIEEKRPFHEQFARGFEAYLFEGKAPSAELQPLFARFRSWLLNVYRTLASLNVQLNPEVRSVFDRLLATNDQITQMQAARDMAPLFKTADDAGMTPEAFAAYRDLGQEATQDAVDQLQTRSLRDMKWLGNARSRALKALQSDATAKRKAMRDEVTAEVRAEPVYAAQRFLKHGELTRDGEQIQVEKGAKLSLDALKEMYGDAPDAPWRELPKGKYGVVTAEEGLHPDLVAEMFGFTSGDEMVRKMLDAQPEREVIEGITDQRMLERYGDLATPEGMQRAADEAIHNEARARFIATELKALHALTNVKGKTVSGGTVDMIVKAAKETAERVIGQKRIRDVKPNQYTAAEAKAARESMKPNASIEERAAQKRNQIISNQLARSAQRALDAVEKGRAAILRAVDNPKIDIDYRDQIAALLDRYDLRRITNKEADRRKSLSEWVQAQTDAGLPPVIDDRLLNEANRKPYREMTVEEFKGLVDAIKNIEHLGRLKDKLLTAQDNRNYQTVRDQIVDSITGNAKGQVAEVRASERALLPRAAAIFRGFKAIHRKFASLVRGFDGFKDGGAAWDNLVRNMNEAGNAEAVRNEQATRKLAELFAPVLKSETGERMGAKRYFEKAGKSFTREERLGIALNLGNEVNYERVMTGEKLSPEALRDILSTLSKTDLQFVKNVWDYLDSFRPEIAAKERRLSGVEPKWVEGSLAPEMAELADRLGVDMGTGGYYPIAYDPNLSSRSAADVNAEVAKQMLGGQYARSQTARGHLKARVESTGRTLRYDFGDIISGHVQQVVHDLAWHEYLIDANRLLKPGGSVDNAIRAHYGPEVAKEMRSTLQDIATGDVAAKNALDRGMNWLRHGTTIAGLGLNVTNTLINLIGITQSMSRIGTPWVLKGMAHWAGDAATFQSSVAKIYEKSDLMRLRSKTMNRELNEIRNKVSGSDSKLQAAWFWLQNRTQLLVDVPTWWGAYEKAMGSGEDMTESKAIALADQAVLDSQGGGQIKDLSGVQRGSAGLKLFTSFYSFFNTTYNLTAEAYGRTNFKRPGEAALFAADMALLYTIPALAGTLVKAALQGEDDPEKLAKSALADQISYLFGTMVGVRETAGAAQAVAGVDPGFGYSGPAAVRFFGDVYKLGKQVGQGEADAAFWKSLNNVGGEVFHYPSGQINRTAAGVAALANGDTTNPGVLLVGPAPKR